MSNTAAPSADDRHAPLALWRIAQAFLKTLYALFGAPEDIARAGVLARAARRQLALWLAAGEAILARLLLIEAAALDPAPTRKRSTPNERKPRRIEHHADSPQGWRVALRLFPRPARRSGRRRATEDRAPSQPNRAWPLAERYEAILRAYNDPQPFALRLARRLRTAPLRAGALLIVREQRLPDLIGRGDFHALTDAADAALVDIDTS